MNITYVVRLDIPSENAPIVRCEFEFDSADPATEFAEYAEFFKKDKKIDVSIKIVRNKDRIEDDF